MNRIPHDTESCNEALSEIAEKLLEKAPPDDAPDIRPTAKDPLLWRLLGAPALPAYGDGYRVGWRIARGCSQSVKGYKAGVGAAHAGGRHE